MHRKDSVGNLLFPAFILWTPIQTLLPLTWVLLSPSLLPSICANRQGLITCRTALLSRVLLALLPQEQLCSGGTVGAVADRTTE